MERTAYQDLINWKNKKNRKPLILNGARQVGKTWLLKKFCLLNDIDKEMKKRNTYQGIKS